MMKRWMSLVLYLLILTCSASAQGETMNRDAAYQAMIKLFDEQYANSLARYQPAIADLDLDGKPELIAGNIGMHNAHLWTMDVWEWDGTELQMVGQYDAPVGELRLVFDGSSPVWLWITDDASTGIKLDAIEIGNFSHDGTLQMMEVLRKEEGVETEDHWVDYYFNKQKIDSVAYEAALEVINDQLILQRISHWKHDNDSWQQLIEDYELSLDLQSRLEPTTVDPDDEQEDGTTWEDDDADECEPQEEEEAEDTYEEVEIWGKAIKKLATRNGPSPGYKDMGTYEVKGKRLRIRARAWDERNQIWWVLVDIPYNREIRTLWTGYSRFEKSSLPLESIPIYEEDEGALH